MKRLSDLSIAGKLVLAMASLILTIVGVNAVNYAKLGFIEKSNGWTQHSYQVLESVQAIMGSMVDQETGVRGYLASGDTKFLEPYRNGKLAYDRNFATIKQLTSDNAAQQARLDELNRFATTWRNDVAEHEIGLMGQPATQEQARQMEASGAGKASMDALRAKVGEIDKVERDLLVTRVADADAAFSTSRFVTLVGAVLQCLPWRCCWAGY